MVKNCVSLEYYRNLFKKSTVLIWRSGNRKLPGKSETTKNINPFTLKERRRTKNKENSRKTVREQKEVSRKNKKRR